VLGAIRRCVEEARLSGEVGRDRVVGRMLGGAFTHTLKQGHSCENRITVAVSVPQRDALVVVTIESQHVDSHHRHRGRELGARLTASPESVDRGAVGFNTHQLTL